jgi:hypothetical protein
MIIKLVYYLVISIHLYNIIADFMKLDALIETTNYKMVR